MKNVYANNNSESKADKLLNEEVEAERRALREVRRENNLQESWWNNATTWWILGICIIIAVLVILWL